MHSSPGFPTSLNPASIIQASALRSAYPLVGLTSIPSPRACHSACRACHSACPLVGLASATPPRLTAAFAPLRPHRLVPYPYQCQNTQLCLLPPRLNPKLSPLQPWPQLQLLHPRAPLPLAYTASRLRHPLTTTKCMTIIRPRPRMPPPLPDSARTLLLGYMPNIARSICVASLT